MVHRVHRHATNFRSQTFPTRAAGLTKRHVLVFDISDLAGFVSEDLASDALRQDMGQFGGFADRPEYLLMEQVS